MRVNSSYYYLLFWWLAILKVNGTDGQTLYIDERFCKVQMLGADIRCNNVDARNYTSVKYNFHVKNATQLAFDKSYLPMAPEDIFDVDSDIQELWFLKSQVQYFPLDFFKNSKKLREFHVIGNNIRAIPDGFFKDTPNLKVVSFLANKLVSVSRNMFAGIKAKNIILDLQRNEIREIHSEAFKGLDIDSLSLMENKLTAAKLGFLKYVDPNGVYLKGNCLGDLPTSALGGKKNLKFFGLKGLCLTNITKLYGALPSSLEYLDASDVDLSALDAGFFITTPNLKNLKIQNTHIKATTIIKIIEILHLESIDFTKNNFNCVDLSHIIIAAKKANVKCEGSGRVSDKMNVDGIPCS